LLLRTAVGWRHKAPGAEGPRFSGVRFIGEVGQP